MPFDPYQLPSGGLPHLIQVQAPSATRDEFGQNNTTFTTILTCRAAIQSTASQTFRFAAQDNVQASNATDVITIRWPGSGIEILPNMQVLFGTKVYTIQVVDNINNRNRIVRLLCVGQGLGS
jgi:SPP1 family predicted phage head-tail adaptor